MLVVHSPYLTTDDWATTTLWAPPSEEQRELLQRQRELEERLAQFDRELESCEGDYPSRVLLKFELDALRGTLFAIANVRELWVLDNKSQQSVQISGAVRFVCDPSRCKWLDQPPSAGEQWISSWGKMIGRDNKGRPIVIANPQVQVDEKARQAIEHEIADLQRQIDRLAGKTIVAEELEQPVASPKDESPRVTQDMLEALRQKFQGG